MIEQVKAVYENGLFRPLEPVSLAESEQVTITVTKTEQSIAPDGLGNEDGEIEPVWRGVFAANREREVLFKKNFNVHIEDLPQRPFTVDMDWHRVTEDE